MQQTDKYNFNLIDDDSLFSPEALNENTRQLARVEDSSAAEIARVDAALDADKTALTTLSQAVVRFVP